MIASDEAILLRNMSAPIRDVMRFVLIYNGPLSASGNKGKKVEVATIRQDLSGQLENLWATHQNRSGTGS